MTLTGDKLRAVIRMLTDERSAHAAAHILTEEAKARGVLLDDLLAEQLAPAPAPSTAPSFSDVILEDDIETAIGKRINAENYGLRSEVLHETDRAWLVRAPAGWNQPQGEVWLPKSQVQHHGEDAVGRAILILPMWLARKKRSEA